MEAGEGPASLSASQLERKVKELVQETIQNYRSDPEKSAAEESWEYVQFQVREAPARPPSSSAPNVPPPAHPSPATPAGAPPSDDPITGPIMAQFPSSLQTLERPGPLPRQDPPSPPRP